MTVTAKPPTDNTAETAAELAQRFPALFAGPPKPIKLRIHVDIQQRAPGVFTKQALSAFFARHTTTNAYLVALTKSTQRFDLDGQPAGELSEEHRRAAHDELARRHARHDEKRRVEQQQRRERADLLRDFERTTLSPANFCALKGIAPEALEGLIAQARREAEQGRAAAPSWSRDRPLREGRHNQSSTGDMQLSGRPRSKKPPSDRREG
jgi:sRNA-binding protein